MTVLMTVCNGLPYLPFAIDSVLRQSFSDLELLIIDDASTDGSLDLIRSYSDPRIRLLCNSENQGQAEALNQGLREAKAEYVARLDQDDVSLPDRLKRQVEFLDRRPDYVGVGTWHHLIGPDGRRIGFESGASDLPGGGYGAFLGLLITQATPVGHPTVMYRRRIVSEVGGYEADSSPSEDFALWTRLALARYSLGVIPEALVMVRIHPRQQSLEKLLLQRRKTAQAHQRFIASFCTEKERPQEISAFLRMDPEVWEKLPSHAQVKDALKALDRVVENLRRSLNLSKEEYLRFSLRLSWWMARGALRGIILRHPQSLSILLFLLRRDIRVLRFSAVWAYPIGLILSFFSTPLLLRWLASLLRIARSLRDLFRRVLPPSCAVAPERGKFTLEQLARAMGEVRRACPCLPVLAIHWMHLKHPIHPVQEELLTMNRKLSFVAVLLGLPGRFFWCLLYGFYLFFRLIQMRLSLRRPFAAVRARSFDIVAKTWRVGSNALGFGEDFYYGDMQKRLEARGIRMLLLCGNSSGKGWPDFLRRNVSTGPYCQLPEGCLVPLSAPLKMPFLQLKTALDLLKVALRMKDPLIRRVAMRAASDCLNRKNIPSGLNYWMGRNAVRLWRPKGFLTFYEGYGWEQCAWAGVKEEDPACKTIGFQHTVLFQHNLELLSPLLEGLAFSRPDIALCLGPRTEILLRSSHLRTRLIPFGTFRRIPDGETSLRPAPGKRSVLVLPEGYLEEGRLLFECAMQAARRLHSYRFIFRCHPILPFEKIRPLLRQDPDLLPNVELSSHGSIEEDFRAASAVLYRGSSAVLYAILHGLKPIYLAQGGRPEVDPLFQLDAFRQKVCSPEELATCLEGYGNCSPETVAEEWLKAQEYVRSYTVPVDQGSIERLLWALDGGREN